MRKSRGSSATDRGVFPDHAPRFPLKRCCYCKESKSLSEFYPRRDTGCGLSSSCKECTDRKNKEWFRTHKSQRRVQRSFIHFRRIRRLEQDCRQLFGKKSGEIKIEEAETLLFLRVYKILIAGRINFHEGRHLLDEFKIRPRDTLLRVYEYPIKDHKTARRMENV